MVSGSVRRYSFKIAPTARIGTSAYNNRGAQPACQGQPGGGINQAENGIYRAVAAPAKSTSFPSSNRSRTCRISFAFADFRNNPTAAGPSE